MKTTDDRLRKESPAYRPDDGWDVLEPQPMQVVLSVRFDARSARRIAELARLSAGTPSRLIRDWTLERLDALESADAVRAVREDPAGYLADGDFEALRDRYRPTRIEMLLVGESRPAGGTFFYLANSNLFAATRDAYVAANGTAPRGAEFLELLQRDGVWLYDIAPAPINRLSGRPRREAVEGRVAELALLLREAKPRRVVVIKRSLEPAVRSAFETAAIGGDRLHVLPFPLYQWRAEYVAGLAQLLPPKKPDDEPREEYDFRGGGRGRHHREFAEAGAVVRLDPDVAIRYPTSDAVNEALRSIPVTPADTGGDPGDL